MPARGRTQKERFRRTVSLHVWRMSTAVESKGSVTPDFVRDLQALGFKDVLVSMQIHGVSVDDARRAKSRQKDLPIDELVDMKIHGRG